MRQFADEYSPADYADFRRIGRRKKICGNLRNLRETNIRSPADGADCRKIERRYYKPEGLAAYSLKLETKKR